MIAKDLRVSERSVERWRHAWPEGGMDARGSTGPAKLPKVSDGQFAELEKELALGPAEHGWEDQRWALARVRALIAWKFGKLYGEHSFASGFVRAVQCAVEHHADVLSQSFGSNVYPDAAADPVRMADDAAITAGSSARASRGPRGSTRTARSGPSPPTPPGWSPQPPPTARSA